LDGIESSTYNLFGVIMHPRARVNVLARHREIPSVIQAPDVADQLWRMSQKLADASIARRD